MSEDRPLYKTDKKPPTGELPQWRTVGVLAIARYLVGEISEGALAQKLDLDRLEARARVKEFLDTAVDNAQVPIERVITLEQRAATLAAQNARLDLRLIEVSGEIAALQGQVHDLRNQLQAEKIRSEELALDLNSERHKLAELASRVGIE